MPRVDLLSYLLLLHLLSLIDRLSVGDRRRLEKQIFILLLRLFLVVITTRHNRLWDLSKAFKFPINDVTWA